MQSSGQTSGQISVVVVDDEPLIRSGLRAIIDAEPDLSVVGEAGDGAEVLPVVRRTQPDVVLMDVRMPAVDGIQATRLLLDGLDSAPRVLVVTTFENDDYVYDALRAGASGFLLKRTPPDDIIAAIRTVAGSESLLFPEAIRALALAHVSQQESQPTGLDQYQLTEREQEVLRLMARGLSNAEIAAELILGVQTIKTHVANLLAKLGARDRTQAVIQAYESGFVPLR
ncbi:response regulator transcription factor [Kribbella sancticallisti]|uniref:Response regulator transcription factor n=1 Tax=Kribbella sancticallisti TaxID=460087 RepID=A0ABN2ER98_9ACTN